jgi:nucleotide-binding universal stress UspA family protein
MSISRILLATDFSKGGERALQCAVAWAKRLGAHVDILHVVEFQPGMDPDQPVSKMYLEDQRHRADGQLKRVVALSADAGLKAEALLRVGIPSQSIIATAQELDSDLVALGTRGVTGLEHLLVGSTAERVIRGSPCPVLTVRTPRDHPTGEPVGPGPPCQTSLDHILVPVDFSDCSLDALEYAVLVARAGQASLTILHVLEPIAFGIDFTLRHVEERRAMRKRTDAWLSRVVEALRSGGMQASYQLEGGVAQVAILSRCQ